MPQVGELIEDDESPCPNCGWTPEKEPETDQAQVNDTDDQVNNTEPSNVHFPKKNPRSEGISTEELGDSSEQYDPDSEERPLDEYQGRKTLFSGGGNQTTCS
jgi:hypothetical protein